MSKTFLSYKQSGSEDHREKLIAQLSHGQGYDPWFSTYPKDSLF